ncbi:MAG: 50S ribosomal protein L11 methyltransferase [Armatimonadota bacterium]
MRVIGPERAEEAITALLLGCGVDGTSSIARGGLVTVSAHLPVGDEANARVAELQSRLAALDPVLIGGRSVELAVSEVEEENWAEAWKRHFKPLRIGRRLVVRPTWEHYEPRPEDVVIALDPGMAFGTGMHETTRLCAQALEELLKGGEFVIDIGCGSGILAIAAALLGAEDVLAIDNDPTAVAVCARNVAQNGLQGRVAVREQTGLDGVVVPANVIVANISAEAVAGMAPNAAALLMPAGCYITSGFTARGLPLARKAIENAGLTVAEERTCGEWVCLLARKPARRADG